MKLWDDQSMNNSHCFKVQWPGGLASMVSMMVLSLAYLIRHGNLEEFQAVLVPSLYHSTQLLVFFSVHSLCHF